jgi:hypothetical protein
VRGKKEGNKRERKEAKEVKEKPNKSPERGV